MSGFKALNLESDDESDVEIDDTKEIQIEEALKLYQTALKFHAEGPSSFDKAAEAYRQLFESEIFRYPESQAELQRIELYGAAADTDNLWDDALLPGPAILTGSLDTGPSTLPQILHLSHKNYAQFKLEALAAKFDVFQLTLQHILSDASEALMHFVQALDKDETDLDLWRRTASVGNMLDSRRVARYCLESVLDGDDEGLEGVWSLPGLEESLAGEQLQDLVSELRDHLSLLQSPLSVSKRKVLSKSLKHQLDPYQDLLSQEAEVRNSGQALPSPTHPTSISLKAPKTWSEMGEVLQRHYLDEQHGTPRTRPALAISFDLGETINEDAEMLEDLAIQPTQSPLQIRDDAHHSPTAPPERSSALENDQSTAQPLVTSAEEGMETTILSPNDQDTSMVDLPTTILPSRKRSGDAAGINDGTDEGRTKSRRIRARDSNVEAPDNRQAIIDANTRWEYEQQLNEIQAADDWMFETVGNLFEKIGIVGFDTARNVRQEMQSETRSQSSDSPPGMTALQLARSDLRSFLDMYSEQQAYLLLHGGDNVDVGYNPSVLGAGGLVTSGGQSRSITKPPYIPDDDLPALIQTINAEGLLTQEAVWKYIEALLRPSKSNPQGNYLRFTWPEKLKTIIVRTLVNFDESLLEKATSELAWLKSDGLEQDSLADADALAVMSETIFELHLDIYCLIKAPNSGVDADTVLKQGDRLQRWFDVAREAMHFRSSQSQMPEQSEDDDLNLRFFWATTFHIASNTDAGQDHVIECMNDLRAFIVTAGEPTIYLQNNAVMPELSVAALDNEITKLTTKDFFLKVTTQSPRDPVADIEILEPLLNALDSPRGGDVELNDGTYSPELVRFLAGSAVSVKLVLWQSLRKAYHDIEYEAMVVWCYFRMIRMVLGELKMQQAAQLGQPDRQASLLKSLRLILNMVKNVWDIVQKSTNALECIDNDMLNLSVSCLGEVLQLLQVFNVAEDSIRVGQTQAPLSPDGLPAPTFTQVSTMFRELQLRIWMILYALLKEALAQNADVFTTPDDDRFDFLRVVHRNLGFREMCGGLNRVFVRMLKDEFFQLTHVEGYETEQAQVLHDLYGMNCFLDPAHEFIEHHCIHDAWMDRTVAMQATDLLLAQASKLPVKELVKHPLKDTIERVHGATSKKKPTDAIVRNRDIYRAFLRSPIVALDLYNCLNGEGNHLPVSIIPKEDAPLASKGWYFLMGHIALTKFRAQKRSVPAPTEDLDIAIAFFTQDLEATMEHWETWFRLAQAYDCKVEETSVWSAEKMNSNMQELVQFQRSAIHCYAMATALANRSADLTLETSSKMTEMYGDFAMRLYSSSRHPFWPASFNADDSPERFTSTIYGIGQDKIFHPLPVYTGWKVAHALFQRALAGNPTSWMLHYMMGKCRWKMHSARPIYDRAVWHVPPQAPKVIESFVRALELLPDKDKKESRDAKREPVLEPHYKLVVIVHKLLKMGSINLEEARAALMHTHYARREDEFPSNMDGWIPYVLRVLRNLRAADKSNWYHRIIARIARFIYDDFDPEDPGSAEARSARASAAKQELTQQMFTKTMVLQVWRPENERAGRHFVYTAHYTRFFVDILEELKDRANLEQLARRVRRRPHDVFEHGLVWQEICMAYLRLLRLHASLPDGMETATFSNIAHEEFLIRKEPLEKWMQATETGKNAPLDVLREVQELKKINMSLMKPGMIDDLIGDAYAYLFSTIGRTLFEEERRIKQEEEARRLVLPPSPARPSIMNIHSLMNLDGSNDNSSAATPVPAAAPPPPSNDQAAPLGRRKIGVGRREIRTAAEGCFAKSNAQASSSASAGVKSNGAAPRAVQVLIQTHRRSSLASLGDNVGSSAPGSIHDSADDESELSELEEGEGDEKEVEASSPPARPRFPGLATETGKEDEESGDEKADGSGGADQEVVMEDTERTDPESQIDPE